tara:strand:+ start:3846 stop:4502 length:657 start_codon:yes stop_codon:yes gene_type:complete
MSDFLPPTSTKDLPTVLKVPGYSIPVSRLIDWLLAPAEIVGASGLLEPREINIVLSDFLLRHSKFHDYGMIHAVEVVGEHTRYYLWRKYDWKERAHVHRIEKAKSDVERTRALRSTKTRDTIFSRLCKMFPKFLTERKLGMEMVRMWIAEHDENDEFKYWLNKLGYFELSEVDRVAVEDASDEADEIEAADPFDPNWISEIDAALLTRMKKEYSKPLS